MDSCGNAAALAVAAPLWPCQQLIKRKVVSECGIDTIGARGGCAGAGLG